MLPDFLPRVQRDFPEIEFDLVHDFSRNITASVIEGRLHAALAINPVPHPDLVLRPLLRDEVSFWVNSKRHDEHTLIYDPQLLQSQELLRRLQKQKKTFKKFWTTSNLEVLRSLVSSGMGVGILPARVAQLDSKLVPLSPKKMPIFEDRLYLVYRPETRESHISRIVIDRMKASI